MSFSRLTTTLTGRDSAMRPVRLDRSISRPPVIGHMARADRRGDREGRQDERADRGRGETSDVFKLEHFPLREPGLPFIPPAHPA